MTRIRMVGPEQDGDLEWALSGVRQRLKTIPDLYRVLGHAPEMLKAWTDFAWPLRLKAKTSRSLRELLILRGAQVSRTAYEWAHHVEMVRDAGLSQDKIDALKSWCDSSLFDERERIILQLADEVTEGPGASAQTISTLQTYFSDEEIVELVLTASFYVCVSRILLSFAIELEPEYAALRPAGW